MATWSKLLKRPLLSPFLWTTGLYIVVLYYLSAYLSTELALASFVIFSVFALCYGLLAWLLKHLFRRVLGSVSLKLTAFFLTTAILPIAMIVLLTCVYLLFLVGLNESYVFMRVIRYEYAKLTGEDADTLAFDTGEGALWFRTPSRRRIRIENGFFDRIHRLTGTEYSVAVVRMNGDIRLSGERERREPSAGAGGVSSIGTTDRKGEAGTNPVYVTVYQSNPDLEESFSNDRFVLSYPHLRYAIVFPLKQGQWQDSILIVIRIDLREFWGNLFSGKSSFATINRGILTFLGGLSLSFLIFELYLLLKGMLFAVSISGSTRQLVHVAQELKAGRFDARVESLSDRNLHAVGESLNAMAANIQALFQEKLQREQMAKELEIARHIQSSVLLEGVFRYGRCDIAVHSRASRVIGGDYCNVHRREDGLQILAGDVSGKGLGAAMYVSEVDGLFYGMASRMQPVEAIVEGLHRFFLDRGGGNTFFSATLLDIRIHQREIRYYRLGDPPLAVCDAAGEWRLLRPKGMIAGMRGVDGLLPYLEAVSLPLAQVSGLFLYSDGFEELAQQAGVSIPVLLAAMDLGDPEQCYGRLRETIARWVGHRDLDDDVTFALTSFVTSHTSESHTA